MNYRFNTVVPDQSRNHSLIAGTADDNFNSFRDRPSKTGGKIIEHDDLITGIEQLEDHMAADISGAASDQHIHQDLPLRGGAFSAGIFNQKALRKSTHRPL